MKQTLDPQATGHPVSIRAGIARPEWTAPKPQVAVLTLDTSLSMDGDKAKDAIAAASGLITALAGPENRGCFYAGIIGFATQAKVVAPLTAATALADHIPGLEPSGSTNVTAALAEARKMIVTGKAMLGENPGSSRPVVVLLSDGVHNVGVPPQAEATALKAEADVVTVAFGPDADEALLTQIATSPDHFYRCKDGAELRKFFAAVGTTLSQSIARGRNAGAALASIPR